MANSAGLLLVGAVGATVALIAYHKIATAPPPVTTTTAFVAPSNLQPLMLAAWANAGKPIDLDGWVKSQLPLFPGKVSYAQWAYVYNQVYGTYKWNGTWGNESQVETWLNAAVNG